MDNTINYLCTLFNEYESTCFGNAPNSYKVSSVFSFDTPTPQFVCLNALDAALDKNPTQPWHASTLPRRADCNVVSYRNFLLECDSLPIEAQLSIAKQIELPFSTSVFSGGKSVHFVVSLESPLKNINEYRSVAQDLMAIVSQFMPIDLSTKNPSRLTRLAGGIRDGVEQTLLECRGRVPNEKLNQWAKRHSYDLFRFTPPAKKRLISGTEVLHPVYTAEMVDLLQNGAPSGQRNNKAFWLCCQLIRKHKKLFEAAELVLYLDAFSLPEHEKRAIVNSALARLKNEFKI